MAVKRTIFELCPRCGGTQARLLPDGTVVVNGHRCPKKPPGPPSPPQRYRPGEVEFVRPKDGCDCLRADEWECTALHLGLDTDQMPDWRARVAESVYGACDCDCHKRDEDGRNQWDRDTEPGTDSLEGWPLGFNRH